MRGYANMTAREIPRTSILLHIMAAIRRRRGHCSLEAIGRAVRVAAMGGAPCVYGWERTGTPGELASSELEGHLRQLVDVGLLRPCEADGPAWEPTDEGAGFVAQLPRLIATNRIAAKRGIDAATRH